MEAEPTFPFRVWRSVTPAGGDGVIHSAGAYVFSAEGDRLLCYACSGEDSLSSEPVAVLSARRNDERRLKKKGTLDADGFASMVYDDVIGISSSVTKEILHIMCLHRSGHVQVWRENKDFIDEESGSRFTSIAVWLFSSAHGAPKLIEAHPSMGVVAIASSSGQVRVFDYSTGALTHTFENLLGPADQSRVLKFHNNRGLLLVASDMGRIAICDLWRKTTIMTIGNAHSGAILDCAMLDLGLQPNKPLVPSLVSISSDNQMKLWTLQDVVDAANQKVAKRMKRDGVSSKDVTTFVDLGKKPLDHEMSGETLDFSTIISKEKKATKAMVSLRVPEGYESIVILTRNMVENFIHESSKPSPWYVLAAGESGDLDLWDLIQGTKVQLRGEVDERLYSFCVARPSIKRLVRTKDSVLAISSTQGLSWWPLSRDRFEPVASFRGSGSALTTASLFSPEPAKLAVYACSLEGDIVRERVDWFNEATSCEVKTMSVDDDSVISDSSISTCGRYLSFVTKLGRLCVVDLKRESLILECPSNTLGPLTYVACSKRIFDAKATTVESGRPFVVTVGTDNFARLWQLDLSGNPDSSVIATTSTMMWRASEKPIYCVAVSFDNAYICTAGADRNATLYKSTTGERMAVLKGHKSSVTAVAFHPKEAVLATAGADGTVRLWNINKHECFETFSGLTSSCTSLLFVNGAKKLVGGCVDGSVHTWSVSGSNRKYLGSSIAHDDRICVIGEMKFAGQDAVVSVSCDGSVKMWRDESVVISEKQLEQTRAEKQDLAQMDVWLNQNDYVSALRAACKWRQVSAFEKIIVSLLKSATDKKGDGEQDASMVNDEIFDLSDLVRTDFQRKEDLEILLLAAVHFCRRQSTLYIAHWICDGILRGCDNILDLRQLDGFREFVMAFNAKTLSQLNRWERLNEKSFLLDLVANDGFV